MWRVFYKDLPHAHGAGGQAGSWGHPGAHGRAPEPCDRKSQGTVNQRARFLQMREGSSRFSKAPPFLSIPRKLKDLLGWGGISLGVRGAAKGGAQNVPAFLPAGVRVGNFTSLKAERSYAR